MVSNRKVSGSKGYWKPFLVDRYIYYDYNICCYKKYTLYTIVMPLTDEEFTTPLSLLASNTINNHYSGKGRNSPLLLFFVAKDSLACLKKQKSQPSIPCGTVASFLRLF